MQAIATASREQRFFTKHETRNTNHGFWGTEALQSFFSVGGRVRLRVMTPLWGTKTPSVPVGARSDGDGRAARSQLSCALWSGMGGYGAAWAATAPRAGNTAFMLFTNHNFPTHHFPRFPTISHDFPAFPGPPHPLRQSSVHAPSAFLGQPPELPRRAAPPGHCFPARCGAVWGGYGAVWAAAVPRTGNTAFPVRRPSDISSGANQAPQPWFSRNTKHETRITAFMLFTRHETRLFPRVLRS